MAEWFGLDPVKDVNLLSFKIEQMNNEKPSKSLGTNLTLLTTTTWCVMS